jgi:hypothetical protein
MVVLSTFNIAPSLLAILPMLARTDEYRLVISYSCTFFSYYDLVTKLDDSITKLLPADFTTTGRMGRTPIPVKSGQLIAHIGS